MLLPLLALGALSACGVPSASGTEELPSNKVFVCKYVGKPGVDERLQTGQNPISVSVNAIPLGDVQIGSEFADAQGRSRRHRFRYRSAGAVSRCLPTTARRRHDDNEA